MLVVLDARPYTLLIKIQGMFENNCFFLSGDLKFKLAQKCSFRAIKELSDASKCKCKASSDVNTS